MTNASNFFAFARARQALRDAGLPDDGEMVSASSTRNEVVLCGEYVVRVNRQPNQRLRREAMWCHSLPLRSWTPRVVAHGGELGADFLIVVRRPGQPLSRAWPTMSTPDRKRAIDQLAAAMAELHSTVVNPQIPRLTRTTHLLDPDCLNPVMPMLTALDRLRHNRNVDPGLCHDLESIIHHTAHAFDDYSTTHMIHGDLTFENVLWDGNTITALLDFEWSRGAPSDIDLDVILRYCALPFAHVPAEFADLHSTSDYFEVPGWLAAAHPAMFDHPHLLQRLTLASIAFDLNELAEEPPEKRRSELGPLHPLNRLTKLLSGTGPLHQLLHRLGLPV